MDQTIFMNNKAMPIKRYFDDLDSLRGIAALLVVLFHITTWFNYPGDFFHHLFSKIISFNNNGGNIGVSFFFVLSGFLITYLMFCERNEANDFRVLNFYMRRLLRIWPLYFVTVIIGFVIYPPIADIFGKSYVESAKWPYYMGFLTNFNNISHGFSLGILGVQWSVAIEEQYYLIWPLLFLWFKSNRKFLVLMIVLFLASNVFILVNHANPKLIYFHTLSAVNEFSVGGLTAYVAFYKPKLLTQFINKIPHVIIVFIYAIGILYIFFNYEVANQVKILSYLKKPLCALFFSFVIIEQSYRDGKGFKLRSVKFLKFLGKISYGIYLLHMVAFQLVFAMNDFINMPFLLNVFLSVSLSILLSYFSYHFFESYFLKYKLKYR